MFCKNCGSRLGENSRFCPACGTRTGGVAEAAAGPGTASADAHFPSEPRTAAPLVGYSSRINDPAFACYLKQTNSWALIFSVIIALAAVTGFYIAGETSTRMSNPQALYIGLGIGAMFLVIAAATVISRKNDRTWDGAVTDKQIRKKKRTRNCDGDYQVYHYTEFAVIIRDDRGKEHRLTAEDDDTVYNYYKVGDRVRHHAGLNSFEKYDKSGDDIIFCSACSTLCSINDDYCYRCKCPLLK